MELNQKDWNEVCRDDLIYLYVEKNFYAGEVAEYFNVSKGKVAYKRKKLGFSYAELSFKRFLN